MVNFMIRPIYLSPPPQGEKPVRIELENRWITEPVGILRRGEKSHTATGILTSDCSARRLVSTTTSLLYNRAVIVLVLKTLKCIFLCLARL